MIHVQLEFYLDDDEPELTIATSVPALPAFGTKYHFVDTDHEIDLAGTVEQAYFSDVDAEFAIVIAIRLGK